MLDVAFLSRFDVLTARIEPPRRAPVTVRGRVRSFAPANARARDIWITVTPVWGLLVLARVLFYGLERLRFPDIVPPVAADAVQGMLLWPLAALGCHGILIAWRRTGLGCAAAVALASALTLGAIARPAYGLGSVLAGNAAPGNIWPDFSPVALGPSVWPWMSNVVEYGALYLSCVAAALGLLAFRGLVNERLLRARVEANAAQERLRTLRAQLNPHFLFNTLNSLVGLSELQPGPTQHLVVQLSELLRRTLHASEHEEQPLSEELAYAEAYLRIQQIRHPSRIEWRVRSGIDLGGVRVPSLILLPLVENAVTHGMRGGCAVDIEIVARRAPGGLALSVANTCLDAPSTAGRPRSGLGLRNVRERLEVLFGADAALVVHRPAPGRFEAHIALPVHSLYRHHGDPQ
jgi:hypothetical protein